MIFPKAEEIRKIAKEEVENIGKEIYQYIISHTENIEKRIREDVKKNLAASIDWHWNDDLNVPTVEKGEVVLKEFKKFFEPLGYKVILKRENSIQHYIEISWEY